MCQQSKCETRCTPCEKPRYVCAKPKCTTTCDCPANTPKEKCASCQTHCLEPVCQMQPCEPECHTLCQKPDCQYHCKQPDVCPQPVCNMVCEHQEMCNTTYHEALPPSRPGEVVVHGFMSPAPEGLDQGGMPSTSVASESFVAAPGPSPVPSPAGASHDSAQGDGASGGNASTPALGNGGNKVLGVPPAFCRTEGPECSWECDHPKCKQVCQPVCQQSKCETRCSVCQDKPQYVCEKPKCTTVCDCPASTPKDKCASCQTHCLEPACQMVPCPPKCHTVCQRPDCEYHCHKPDVCPQPSCNMVCEHQEPCNMTYHGTMPSIQPGEVVVHGFTGPAPKSFDAAPAPSQATLAMPPMPAMPVTAAPTTTTNMLQIADAQALVSDASYQALRAAAAAEDAAAGLASGWAPAVRAEKAAIAARYDAQKAEAAACKTTKEVAGLKKRLQAAAEAHAAELKNVKVSPPAFPGFPAP